MREFKPLGDLSVDTREYADYVFHKNIGSLIEKLLADIEESEISAEKAKLVPDFLSEAIENRNQMALTVSKFNSYPERQAAGQWQHQ